MKTLHRPKSASNSVCVEAEACETPLSAFLSLFHQEYCGGLAINAEEASYPVTVGKADPKRKAS